MKDNFDLKKFLKDNQSIENLNSSFKSLNENMSRKDAKSKIKEMIIDELSEEMDPELDYEGASEEEVYGDYKNDDESYYQHSHQTDIELEEAKEEEETEEVESEETEETEETKDEASEEETEEKPETRGGIEDIAADMEGNEGDLMDHLISALKVSKSMDNEKLTTQIGNTLKFFVGEYIGGEE